MRKFTLFILTIFISLLLTSCLNFSFGSNTKTPTPTPTVDVTPTPINEYTITFMNGENVYKTVRACIKTSSTALIWCTEVV